MLAYGIRLEAALSLVNRLATDAVPLPMDGRPRVSVLPEYWGGEIATLALADADGAIGEVHLLGPAGFSSSRPLADARRRQALVNELMTVIRLHQERSRLQQENRQLSSILYFSGDGIVTVDSALRITGFNQAMETMTAWHPHEAMGKLLLRCPAPTRPAGQAARPRPRPAAAGDLQRANGAQPRVDPADARRPACQCLGDGGGLSARRRASRSAACSTCATSPARARPKNCAPPSSRSSRTSCRRRSPSSRATPRPWRARMPAGTPRRSRERLHAIEEEADRLNHLVGNVLYASRIQAGGLTMERGELDLSEMTRSVVRRFLARSPDRKISVRLPGGDAAGLCGSRAHRGGAAQSAG